MAQAWQPEIPEPETRPGTSQELSAAAWRDLQRLQQSADAARVSLAYWHGWQDAAADSHEQPNRLIPLAVNKEPKPSYAGNHPGNHPPHFQYL